jgi:hypothetical protein
MGSGVARATPSRHLFSPIQYLSPDQENILRAGMNPVLMKAK